MKPGMKWLAEKYPLHYQRIIELVVERHSTFMLDSPPYSLDCLFNWDSTTEGWEYWNSLNNGYVMGARRA